MDGVANFMNTEALVLMCHRSIPLQRKLTPLLAGSGELVRRVEGRIFVEMGEYDRGMVNDRVSNQAWHRVWYQAGSRVRDWTDRQTRSFADMLEYVSFPLSCLSRQFVSDGGIARTNAALLETLVERVSWLSIDDDAWEKSWEATAGSAWSSAATSARRLLEGEVKTGGA